MPIPVTLVFRSQRIHLPAGSHEIGRAETCTIVLDDPHVSRRHARLDVDDQRVLVTDLGSRAGTRVNGHRIVRPHLAAPGDQMLLGKQQFEFAAVRSTGFTAPTRSELHGFLSCAGCGYLVIRNQKWCPVCRSALDSEEAERTTKVRYASTSTMSLDAPRAVVVITPNAELLRGISEWVSTSANTLVVAVPTFEAALPLVVSTGGTVVVDLDLVEPDGGKSLLDLQGISPSSRIIVMGPAELNFRELSASWNLGRTVRAYLPRMTSPIDLLGRVQHLRVDGTEET